MIYYVWFFEVFNGFFLDYGIVGLCDDSFSDIGNKMCFNCLGILFIRYLSFINCLGFL